MKALNRQYLLLVTLLCLSLPGLGAAPLRQPATAAQDIYTDALAPGWSNWSWATVDLQAAAPVHSGSRSIAVTYSAWQGLYLHYPELSTAGFTYLRFFIHGGSAGDQWLNVYATYPVNGSDQNGPSVAVPSPTANAWSEVRITLADLGVANASLTGLVWQDSTGGAQPTLYIDDIALVTDESPDGPTLSAGYLLPRAAPADGRTEVVVRVQVSDPQGLTDIASVTLDGTALGRGKIALRDDGWSNDGAASDGVYGGVFTVAPGTSSGEQILLVTAQDKAGHRASLQLGALVAIVAPAGGNIPSALPQHIGWGSNAWSETPGQDWQVNSGVPWNYVYQYITYDWYVNGWGGNFVGRFVNQAWSKGYVPLISVYMILDVPPTCGESATCYADKLQNATAVSTYLAALQEAARQAQGTHPVVFHLEPDFYGYMQQLSNSDERPAGVQPDDPNSYSVALNVAGYPNTLAGFGRRMVDVIHVTAPNALVAPMASMWATNGDPNSVTVSQVISMGQRTAAFIDAMGGAQSDLLVAEWSDRDAGSGLRPWWDDTNLTLPRPTRAILWENALSAAAHKRLILWQMPVGNMLLDNTCDHYRDNRAAYAFQHPRDLFDAGVFAVLFGGGAECQTQVTTDGGFVAAQGAIAYAPPLTPTGLYAGTVAGPLVPVHWNENTEPDVWGYRVSYQPAQGGSSIAIDAGRKNALTLLLPRAGDWRISVAAYDAMGQVGSASAAITVTTTVNAQQIYLPLIRR
jgi:hypothetical protein